MIIYYGPRKFKPVRSWVNVCHYSVTCELSNLETAIVSAFSPLSRVRLFQTLNVLHDCSGTIKPWDKWTV
jgi:hypothetical protein